MEIAEIKSRLTLAMVLHHYGLKPDKHHRLHCPFHEDKTPSLQVYYKTHTAYCFSANCRTHGKSMDVIDFIMHMEKISKGEAIRQAVTMLSGASPKAVTAEHLTRTAILTRMFSYFRNAVHNSKPAQDYLQKRGLDPVFLASCGSPVGYNSGQYHHGSRRDESLIRSCVEAGLLLPFGTNSRNPSQPSYKSFGKECICFGLKNRAGQVSGMYFRSTVNDKDSRHYYLKDRSGLYPHYPQPHTKQLILTESIIDAATLLQHEEVSNAYSLLALYGTNGLTEEHREAVSQLKALEEVIFFLNGDEPGRKATAKHAETLRVLKPEIKITQVNVPENEDINSLAQSHDPGIFTHLLEKRSLFFSTEKESSNPEASTLNPESPSLNTRNPFKIAYKTDTACYYIQGGVSKVLDSMKVTLVIEKTDTIKGHPDSVSVWGSLKSRNKVDLYEDKQVEKLCKEVAEKLNLRKDILEADIYKLTDLLDDYRENELLKSSESENPEHHGADIPLTVHERQQIENFGKKENLIQNLNNLLGKAGIVGEEKNRIFLLIIAASYKMPETLHALIQGSSGSGKTRLLKQISDCIPAEKVTRLTRVSDKVLYNYPEKYFMNRLLCLEDIDGLSEEAEFAFRELQSNGELNSATSSKLENGQIVAGQKTVRGPIASLACTTRGEIYEDNMSRCFLIAVDESMEQTRRIIEYQNKRAAGLIDKQEEKRVTTFVQNFIRELKPYEVLNPFANQIHLPEEAHKIRRLNDLFQSFVKMITVLNQYQRRRDERSRLITEIADIETAVEIMFESIVLKVDELDGSLRQFYEKLKTYLKKAYKGSHDKIEFTQREIRQYFNLSKAQCSRYFTQLTEFEYITTKQGHNLRKVTYKVDYWDNYAALRERIKTNLLSQLEALKSESMEQ